MTHRQQANFEGEGEPRALRSPRAYDGEIRTVKARTSLRLVVPEKAVFEGRGEPGNLLSARVCIEGEKFKSQDLYGRGYFKDPI